MSNFYIIILFKTRPKFEPIFTNISFERPWQPNESIIYRVIFAKELNYKNRNEIFNFDSRLGLSHTNFPPKTALLSIGMTTKGVYGTKYDEVFTLDLKENWEQNITQLKVNLQAKEDEEVKKKAEEEKKKKKESFFRVLENAVNQL